MNIQGIMRKRTLALSEISIEIKKGEFVAVLGHNGSGKSTFAKHLNALLLPTDGVVYIKGMDTTDEKHLWDIRQTAGMVFQNPDNQIVATLVEEDVAFGPENLGVKPELIRQRVDQALLTVEMYEYRKHSPASFIRGAKAKNCHCGHYSHETGVHHIG